MGVGSVDMPPVRLREPGPLLVGVAGCGWDSGERAGAGVLERAGRLTATATATATTQQCGWRTADGGGGEKCSQRVREAMAMVDCCCWDRVWGAH
jgi:hypothetical protein